ncbi:hypothetical protein ASE95_06195 [Sphingomonas sp. Leaf231]|uniref:DUF1345 domain-containing protein n=1 Tax=Sphingomonas sp. Leaf231 TaxID=1736301 RepID=UPI0006F9866A|nr:DUF1345 domain-containing protein [Sphingomonas sp. Leaf231]KQN92334.1 hypothetical protein ASE95_06195 [Sphingomonas sp. Leaf231]
MHDRPRWRGPGWLGLGQWRLGRRIAPPRFVLFALMLVASVAALLPELGHGRAMMAGFDLAAIVFLLGVSGLFRGATPARLRAAAQANDANRTLLLAITAAVMLVILTAVREELVGRANGTSRSLVIATLALAWLFSNMVYTLHYAHLFYMPDPQGRDAAGIDFPGTDTPDYWDFLYFSYTLGMTFQTSDVTIRSTAVRRAVLGQCLAGFVFNIGVIAFSINVLGAN